MTTLNRVTRAFAAFPLWAMTALALPAQTFITLHSFSDTDGAEPQVSLAQGIDGAFYGTTKLGGANGDGTVFKISPNGTLSTLHSFDDTDGAEPSGGLILATDGNFYGTTQAGGASGDGTVFKISPSGMLTTLYSFCSKSGCTDGADPSEGLVQAVDGSFYGPTADGGADGDGTVFKITPSGILTTLHTFDVTDGSLPSRLVQATNGILYGTTEFGGVNPIGFGTVFGITTSGTLTTLHSFESSDGEHPYSGLIQGSDGILYGTTIGGGGGVESGTVFGITTTGTLTTLLSFSGSNGEGANPYAGLVQGTDGNLYGTTIGGGADTCGGGCGTAFEVTLSGKLTTLYSFDYTDGYDPYAALVQGTDGSLYGTTLYGGTMGYGTVFSMSVGLGAFVETNPTSGNVGAAVKILGTNLTGTTSVSFNSTPATFTALSKSEITSTVPVGATTGTVQVVTPRNGTLLSNVPFTVK
jgi:uncharacterized repeat protein (TIGR03803 family)